jgi:hypothetical protein
MEMLYKLGLQQLLDAIKSLEDAFGKHEIQDVWVVGGTAKSKRWFQPDLTKALEQAGATAIYPAIETMSTIPRRTSVETMLTNSSHLVSEGGARAGFKNCVTSRLSTLRLGVLVSRSDLEIFKDKKVWGNPVGGLLEVVEIFHRIVCTSSLLAGDD